MSKVLPCLAAGRGRKETWDQLYFILFFNAGTVGREKQPNKKKPLTFLQPARPKVMPAAGVRFAVYTALCFLA